MKVTCPISGTSYNTGDQIPLHITAAHPIFQTPLKRLFKLVADHDAGRLDDLSSRLLFVALLNSTGCLKFRVGYAAQPNKRVVEANFQAMLGAVSWIHSVRAPSVKFPGYMVGPDTEDMSSISAWLRMILEAKQDFTDGVKNRDAAVALAEKELVLTRMVQRRNAGSLKQLNRSAIADWALDVSEAPENMRELWRAILVASKDDLACGSVRMANGAWLPIDKETVGELEEHMDNELPHATSLKFEVMQYIKGLLNKQVDGLGLFELVDSEGNIINYIHGPDSTVTEALELPPEPQQQYFVSKVDYLIAKAKWVLACGQMKVQQAQAAKLQADIDSLDALIGDSEGDDDSGENE